MHGNPARKRKCKRRDECDAPVTHDDADESRKDQNAAGRDQPCENAAGTNGAGRGGIESFGVVPQAAFAEGLTQADDEIRSFAGLAGGDPLVGNDDRPAG